MDRVFDSHQDVAGLPWVISTDELSRRPTRPPDHASENRALVALAEGLTASPDGMLQRLAETALDLCRAHSAGLSLLDEDRKRFYWPAIAGQWASHIGGGTPRDFGPCGTVLDRNVPLLFSRPDRHFTNLALVTPHIEEGLLIPFYVDGEAVGTIWIIGHDQSRRFDAEDLRVMTNLARFAAAVYQTRRSLNALVTARQEAQQNAAVLVETNSLKDKLSEENRYLQDQLRDEAAFDGIIGDSPLLKHVLHEVEMVASTDATVLLFGETGTGKGQCARTIHDLSARSENAFIMVNCSAIPGALFESELFGHEKGAFTGATSRKLGRFDVAHRGTLFLDEVGDIPLDVQPKLLRVLHELKFERLGSTQTISADVRIIAATNRNLPELVAAGHFREDLYYRLKVFPITVPPLRDRREDIPALVWHFVKKHAARMNRPIETIPLEAIDALIRWNWPGNVRELGNFLERAVILTRGPILQIPLAELTMAAPGAPATVTFQAAEREAIVCALRETSGVIGGPRGAAARLGLKRTTLTAKMQRLGISRHRP